MGVGAAAAARVTVAGAGAGARGAAVPYCIVRASGPSISRRESTPMTTRPRAAAEGDSGASYVAGAAAGGAVLAAAGSPRAPLSRLAHVALRRSFSAVDSAPSPRMSASTSSVPSLVDLLPRLRVLLVTLLLADLPADVSDRRVLAFLPRPVAAELVIVVRSSDRSIMSYGLSWLPVPP